MKKFIKKFIKNKNYCGFYLNNINYKTQEVELKNYKNIYIVINFKFNNIYIVSNKKYNKNNYYIYNFRFNNYFNLNYKLHYLLNIKINNKFNYLDLIIKFNSIPDWFKI